MYRILMALMLVPAVLLSGGARASEVIDELAGVMRLSETFAIMAEEGVSYGHEIKAEMFPDRAAESWEATVSDIYAIGRTLPAFLVDFSEELARTDADLEQILAFFQSDLGRRVTTLEISARRAMLEPSVKDAARLRLDEMAAQRDPRLGQIDAFVTSNDLVEYNVTSALNASYAFYLGLADSGAFGATTDDSEMLANVWLQEPSIRKETETWIRSYLVMAYAPLSDGELADYIALSDSKAGRDLNQAMFFAFDRVFTRISRQLGRAAGKVLLGRDL